MILALLNVVKDILNKNYISSLDWISKTITLMKDQLNAERTTAITTSNQTPDVVLVKFESFVEIIHYLTIFLVGLCKKIPPSGGGDENAPNFEQLKSTCLATADMIPTIIEYLDDHSSIKLPEEQSSPLMSGWPKGDHSMLVEGMVFQCTYLSHRGLFEKTYR